MRLGPRLGSTKASTGRDLFARVGTKRIQYALPGNYFRTDPFALPNIAPGGTGNTRAYCKVAWLRVKFGAINRISVAESKVS